MAKKIANEIREEVDRQLKGGISIRAVVANLKPKVSRSYVEGRSKVVKQEEKDIKETAVIIGELNSHVSGLEQRYNIADATRILTKSVKIAEANDEINKILANGATGLLMANMMGADVYSKQILKKIQNGQTVEADEIINMVAINNQAPKVAETLKSTLSEAIIKEESGGGMEQTEIDFEADMNEDEAIKIYEQIKSS